MWLANAIKWAFGYRPHDSGDELDAHIEAALEKRLEQSSQVREAMQRELTSTTEARNAALDVINVLQKARGNAYWSKRPSA
jgi:diphthamide synthase subunit DPH2